MLADADAGHYDRVRSAFRRRRRLLEISLAKRRAALEKFAESAFRKEKTFRLSPETRSLSAAKKWLRRTGANLDGIIAKRIDLPYRRGLRDGMQKIKTFRSADCVVGGFRYNEGPKSWARCCSGSMTTRAV